MQVHLYILRSYGVRDHLHLKDPPVDDRVLYSGWECHRIADLSLWQEPEHLIFNHRHQSLWDLQRDPSLAILRI